MKKRLTFLIGITLLLAIGTVAYAAKPDSTQTQTTTSRIPASTATPKLTPAPPKEITIKVDGKDVKWPIVISKVKPKISTPKPYMQREAVMVPLKPVAAVIGYKVGIKGKTVTVASGTAKTTFTLGDAKAVVNGTEKALQTPAVLKNNAVYVPAELLSPMFGFTNQDWFADTKTLAIYSQFAVQDLWTRLYNSNRYEFGSKDFASHGDWIIPKGLSSMRSFYIVIDTQPEQKSELLVSVFRPSYEVRQMLKDVLKLAYPNSWEGVYDLYMKVQRDELFEANFRPANVAAAYNHYFENRRVNICKTWGVTKQTAISIGYVGYIYKVQAPNPNPEAPIKDSDMEEQMVRFRLYEY